jgi:hypothetical protein
MNTGTASLVEKLRAAASPGHDELLADAAAEIEAGEDALKAAGELVDGLRWELDATKRAREHVEAENKRLREALRGMVEYSLFNERWQDAHPEYVAAARAALGETE